MSTWLESSAGPLGVSGQLSIPSGTPSPSAPASAPLRSHLLVGTVRHRRLRPHVRDFRHAVYYLALDLDELIEIAESRLTRTLTTAECVTYHFEECP